MTVIDADPYLRDYASPSVDRQSASVVQIETSKLMPMLIVLAILCGLAIGLTAFAFVAANNAERESRMLQYYVLEMDAKLIAAGVKKPDESVAGKLRSKP